MSSFEAWHARLSCLPLSNLSVLSGRWPAEIELQKLSSCRYAAAVWSEACRRRPARARTTGKL